MRPRTLPKAELRYLFVTPNINDKLQGKHDDGFPHVLADKLIHIFAAGYTVSVSLQGDSSKGPDLERLKGLDEIWVMCFRKPRPGWRLFGRFYQKDTFIGIDIRDRHELGTNSNYTMHAQGAIVMLNALMQKEPIRSNDLGSYLSGVVRNVDDTEF